MYRVLVATDGSPAALRALRFAHDAVRGRGQGRLHALSVLEVVSEDVRQLVPAAEIDRVLDAEGRAMREAVESTLGPQAASIDFEALPGHAPRTIVERAKALGVDEIVMGTRGRGPVAGLLLGSVAARVVQLAHCPVTLVR
jgi:nucleotide-binding universal stress UspA family protein